MPTPLENAYKRLVMLNAEIKRIQRFIDDYHEFSGAPETALLSPMASVGETGGGNVSQGEKSLQTVDKSDIPRMSRRRGGRPDEIAQMIERVIREVGEPMTRGQLVEALERRDVELPAADKARYVGTIIWRHKSIFVNIEGRGYWLRDSPAGVRGIPPNTPYSEPPQEDEDLEGEVHKPKFSDLFE